MSRSTLGTYSVTFWLNVTTKNEPKAKFVAGIFAGNVKCEGTRMQACRVSEEEASQSRQSSVGA